MASKLQTSALEWIIVIIVIAAAIAFVWNTITYDKIRKDAAAGRTSEISEGEATNLFWFNLVMSILSILAAILLFVLIFVRPAKSIERLRAGYEALERMAPSPAVLRFNP